MPAISESWCPNENTAVQQIKYICSTLKELSGMLTFILPAPSTHVLRVKNQWMCFLSGIYLNFVNTSCLFNTLFFCSFCMLPHILFSLSESSGTTWHEWAFKGLITIPSPYWTFSWVWWKQMIVVWEELALDCWYCYCLLINRIL